jgi:hypothetical protein
LYPYWGAFGYRRPMIDVWVTGPLGAVVPVRALIDTGSDYTILEARFAPLLGLRPPFPRRAVASGAGGHSLSLGFPDDGEVGLFVTDYTEYYYLPAPLIGFHATTAATRSTLGITGFLQHFTVHLFHELSPPEVELAAVPGFPGTGGVLPTPRPPLLDFIRGLRLGP